MRSHRVTHNLIAVSANTGETALNEFQDLDTTLMVATGDMLNLEPRRENNADEATGREEPDTVYDLGATAGCSFSFEKAKPGDFALLAAFGLGVVETVAAGTGYLHTFRPIDGDLDTKRSLPSMPAAQRYGKTVVKRRFASMFVDSISATFAADSWVTASGTIKGTGKHEKTVTEEVVSAAENATALVLAANGVHGAEAGERLDNVQIVQVELAAGVWTPVTVTAVSDAVPAELTIEAPGESTDLRNYKILYMPPEPAWAAFPGRVIETPLRVAQANVTVGGKWDGSAFQGGRSINSEFKSLEWSLSNNLQIEFVPGAGGEYASRAFRDGRSQTIKLNREVREYLLQRYLETSDTFGVHVICEGAEYEPGHKYTVELIFPKVGITAAPLSADGKRLAEAGDLIVLEDATHGSVIVRVKNLVSQYAA
ncbi:MAG: hypothetical protein ACNI3A_18740 [Desulfovibrio sp.]|uniref:hypothetical protein n=1 Tax=Desulfovibrio sp. 7SRBS1 TaxID=3378064 RepID=UPI003B3F2193